MVVFDSNVNTQPHQKISVPLVPFYFIRHGQTEWNRLRITQGQTDIPLNEYGIAQAHDAAQFLKTISFASIAASPLARAAQTAEIIAYTRSVPVTIIDELKEGNFGAREGQPKDGGIWFEKWRNGQQYENAETFESFTQRVMRGLHKSLELPGPVLIISHGGVYWALQHALNMPIENISHCIAYYHTPPQHPFTSWYVHELE